MLSLGSDPLLYHQSRVVSHLDSFLPHYGFCIQVTEVTQPELFAFRNSVLETTSLACEALGQESQTPGGLCCPVMLGEWGTPLQLSQMSAPLTVCTQQVPCHRHATCLGPTDLRTR